MSSHNPKRPRDPNQLAKFIINTATGQPTDDTRGLQEVDRSKVKGGEARAAKLSSSRRSDIARQAAKARWTKG